MTIRAIPFGAVATVLFVLLGVLLGPTPTVAEPVTPVATVTVRLAADAPPVVAMTAHDGSQSGRDSDIDCGVRCAPACTGLDHGCVAFNPAAPLSTAEKDPAIAIAHAGAVSEHLTVLRQQHQPAPSLVLLSIKRI